MDPATAIGLACSILSLIDFSYKVISGTYKIAKHGSTVEYDNVESVVNDLHALTLGLQGHEFKGTSPHETALRELASKCETLSGELSVLLQTLKATEGSRWDSVMTSLRSARKKGEVAKKRSMLAEYRSQVSVQLLALLNERHVLIWTRIEWEFKEKHADLVQRLSDLQALVQDMLDNQSGHGMCLAETNDEVLVSKNMREILAVLSVLVEASRPAPPEVRILRQLYFKSMYDREDSIDDTGANTYKWLLDDGADGELEEGGTFIHESLSGEMVREAKETRQLQMRARVNFLKWLSSGSRSIFHISGKAGSGKSTLMKFLSYHKRTREELAIWSGDKPLIFAQFFAWNIGTDGLNNSIYGLCRSILFAVLRKCPDLIPEVFPDAYHTFLRTPYEPFVDEPLFRYSEVLEGLRKLTTRSTSYGYRFCFFIDGLNEFKNDFVSRHSHKLLVDILTSWAENGDVKLLVSSRPTNEFISAFSNDLRIKLHELTKFDIMHFGQTEFEKSTEFERVKDFYMTLVNRVTEEAQGVFLWARLTIAKLLQAMEDIQDVDKLVKLIDDTPQDIHNLYQSLLDSVDSSYQNKILKILWLVGQGVSCKVMWITWIDELFTPDFPMEYEIQAYSDTEMRKRLREAEFLILQAKGLLEFETRGPVEGAEFMSSSVTFSHRNVREFMMRSEQMRIFSENLRGLDVLKIETKAMLAELWFLDHKDSQVLTHGLGKRLESTYSWRSGREDSAILLGAFEKLIQHYVTNGVALPQQTITSYIFDSEPPGMSETKFPYLHWVAGCVGDCEFLLHRLQDQPRLAQASRGLSLLLSAAVSQVDSPIFCRLLEMGASPNETIQLTYPSGSSEASVWSIFCMVVANAIVEAVAYSRHLQDTSWRDILSFSSHQDFYRIFCERLKIFLKMGEVDRDVFIIMGQKGIKEKNITASDGTHIVSLKDLIKQFDKDNADSWEELFNPNPNQVAVKNSQDIWSYLTRARLYDMWNSFLGYTMKILTLDHLATAWDHMPAQRSQVVQCDQPPQQNYLPFKLGMKANKRGSLFYVHSVVIGEAIVSAWDMEVRMF
ncbi:hypothetical protein F5B19DRAFT_455539 [Rostrohypoxylon terebratum]|nr:hypothetical protein F5B19DRAFT_455539 [Rostrohypoxylon terebratum]